MIAKGNLSIIESFAYEHKAEIDSHHKAALYKAAHTELPNRSIALLIAIMKENDIISKEIAPQWKNDKCSFYVYQVSSVPGSHQAAAPPFQCEVDFWHWLTQTMKEQYSICCLLEGQSGKEIDVVLLGKRTSPITTDVIQQTLFDTYSRSLVVNAVRSNATLEDYIHCVLYHTVDKICSVSPEAMKELYPLSQRAILQQAERDEECDFEKEFRSFEKNELMGCFIDLYNCRLTADDCSKMYNWLPIDSEDKNIIVLCPQNICDFAKTMQCDCDYDDWCKMMDSAIDLFTFHIINTMHLTFLHEFGHLVFSWFGADDHWRVRRKKQERQANYFASYVTNGQNDLYIKKKTDRQPEPYHDPWLVSEKTDQECKKELYDFLVL